VLVRTEEEELIASLTAQVHKTRVRVMVKVRPMVEVRVVVNVRDRVRVRVRARENPNLASVRGIKSKSSLTAQVHSHPLTNTHSCHDFKPYSNPNPNPNSNPNSILNPNPNPKGTES
jgi:hypothetical protein